jgi:hypothetical protein
MFKKLTLIGAALAMSAGALIPAAPAAAQSHRGYDNGRYEGRRDYREDRGYRNDRGYRGQRNNYRGDRGRNRCSDGTTGTVIGAIAGGLLGNQVAGRGDRTAGTLLGGVVGGLAGRSIDRGGSNGCRR